MKLSRIVIVLRVAGALIAVGALAIGASAAQQRQATPPAVKSVLPSAAAQTAAEEEAEEAVPLDAVPAAALAAAQKAVPDGTPTEAEKETEDGVVRYCISFDTPDGEVEVEVTADGKVVEVEKDDNEDDDEGDEEEADEEEIALTAVPEVVMAAAQKAVPDGEPAEAEKAIEDGKVWYEIEFRTTAGEVEVKVSEDGKTVHVDQDDDEEGEEGDD